MSDRCYLVYANYNWGSVGITCSAVVARAAALRRRGVARDEVAWCGSAVPGWVSFGGYHHCLLVCIATDLTLPRVLSD